MVGEGSAAEQPRSRQALAFLVAAALAGSVLGLVDTLWALARGLDVLSALGLWVLLLFAALLVAYGMQLVQACMGLFLRLFPRVPGFVFSGLLAALFGIPLGRALFSGAGVGRTALGAVGPYLLPPVLGLFVAGVHGGLRPLLSSLPHSRFRLVGLACALALGALLFDRLVLAGLYTYLHVLAVVIALASLSLAARVLLPPRPWHAELGAVLTCVAALGFVVMSRVFPQHNSARAFLVEQRPFAERVMAGLGALFDFDGDGGSILFVGGDCDDFDPNIGHHALDYPNNLVDEDCNGVDARPVPARRPYGGDAELAKRLGEASRARPTVVLVVDALRADRVGRPGFPNLAQLAAESAHFVNAYASASSTARSVPGMVTGRALPTPEHDSAFDILRRKGIRSALVTVDIVADTITGKVATPGTLRYPFLRGFTQVELVRTGHGAEKSWGGGVKDSTDARVTDRAFALLDGKTPPQVLWVHYFDLHQWMMLSAVKEPGYARYDATLRRVDQELGRWLARKQELNLVFVSDHGEALGQHGSPAHTQYLWSSMVRVPLMLAVPGVAPQRVTTPVSLVDLAPTVLSLSGLPANRDYDLLSLLDAPHRSESEFPAFETRQVSLLEGRYRVIFDQKTRASWLYDVLADPEEKHSLAERDPARAQRMIDRALALRVAD